MSARLDEAMSAIQATKVSIFVSAAKAMAGLVSRGYLSAKNAVGNEAA